MNTRGGDIDGLGVSSHNIEKESPFRSTSAKYSNLGGYFMQVPERGSVGVGYIRSGVVLELRLGLARNRSILHFCIRSDACVRPHLDYESSAAPSCD